MSIPDRPRWSQIVFGEGPKDFLSAWHRLPPDTHPAFSEERVEIDEPMMHLYNLRSTLAETIINISRGTLGALEERLVPLTPEDVGLLERWSFSRNLCEQEISWSTLPQGSLWNQIYGGGDNCYLHYQLGSMKPVIDDSSIKFVWIETSDRFSDKSPTNYDIGIITTEEWEELRIDLKKMAV